MIKRNLGIIFIVASAASLAACGGGHHESSDQPGNASSSSSLVSGAIDHAMDKASAAIASHNITISSDDDNTPKAEITPQGDLLIAGKPVPLTADQRKEVLAYRQMIVGIAQQGIDVGKQGAKLGISAAGAAIAGVLSGKSEQEINERVKAQTSGIRQAAAKICDRMPAVMASQKKLAADLPAFKPYADMTQSDIDECRENALDEDD